MSEIQADLKYTEEHEWLRIEGDTVVCGITDYAQDQLGDVVFIEAPEVDAEVESGAAISTIESVKAVSDIYAPINGTIIAFNEALADDPALVNSAAYTDGWLFKMKVANSEELDKLLDAKAYEELIKSL